MKRVLIVVSAGISAIAAAYALLPTPAQADPPDVVTLCHITGQPGDLGVIIEVSRHVEDGHRQHGDCGPARTLMDPDEFHCTCLPPFE